MIARIVLLLLFLAGASFGGWLLIGGLSALVEAAQSSHWPITLGEVTHSVVKTTVSTTRKSNSRSYAPEIVYTYTVANHTYIGTIIAPGREWGWASTQEAILSFPRGSKPNVFYSPNDPTQTVLVPGLHPFNFGQAIAALLVLTFSSLFGIGLLSIASRRAASSGNSHPKWPKRIMILIFVALILEFAGTLWLSQ